MRHSPGRSRPALLAAGIALALLALDAARAAEDVQAQFDKGARGVQLALRSLSTQLSGAQVGITVTNLAIGFLAEPAIADLIDDPLASAGVPDGADPNLALLHVARELVANRDAILAGKIVEPLGPKEIEGLGWLMGADGVIDCGGANLTPHWKSFFHEKCLDYLIAARPLAISGQGIDRFDYGGDRALLAAALERADQVTVRERISAEYLETIGCKAPISTTGDDALTLFPKPQVHLGFSIFHQIAMVI